MPPRTQRLDLYVAAHTEQAEQKLGRLAGFLSRFGEALRLGFGIDVARRITDLFADITRNIEEAVRVGIRFNQTLEDAQLAIAAVLRSTSPELFRGFDEALIGAREIIRGLQREALRTQATFEELVEASQGIIGPAIQAGIPVERIAEVTALISRAVSVARPGAPSWQILQEARALLTGDITQHADVARMLGITRQEVLRAQEQGRMYEFLVTRLAAFNTAAERASRTLSVMTSNLRDLFTVEMARVTERLLPVIKDGIRWLHSLLEQATLQRLIDLIAQISLDLGQTLAPVLRLITWLLDKLISGFQLLYYSLRGVMDFIGTFVGTLIGGGGLREAIRQAARAYDEQISHVLQFREQLRRDSETESTRLQADIQRRRQLTDQQRAEIQRVLTQQLQDLNNWWRSILGLFTQRTTVRVEHGLGYTYGAIRLEYETLNIQRSILESLRQIYARLQAGIQIKLDSLEL